MLWVLIALLVIILIIAFNTIKVVKQSEVYIIERLGKFHKVADAGLTVIIPFVDHVRSIVSLKQQTMDIPPQGVITQDNVTITIDTVVFYKITDPARAVYEIQNLKKGIEYLAITTIRDIVGKMDLDDTFSSRDAINDRLRVILDEATDQWGCKVDRVEIKDITPPADIRDAMEKQMNALSVLGLLSRFVGMLTDSRSFLSYPRHEYFRRTLCNLVGRDVENGEIPASEMDRVNQMIEDISYNNAKNFFKF